MYIMMNRLIGKNKKIVKIEKYLNILKFLK